MNYIAYYRVSTQKQGESKLGLEAQKREVNKILGVDDILLAEYQEIESGKNNERPELQKAINHCKSCKVTLLIAKLDRLSRSLTFISQLMDSKVEFKTCDMPEASTFTIQIFAALAEQEARFISQRTKAALAELKEKGVKLGSPQNLTENARQKSISIRAINAQQNENNRKATAFIISMRNQGYSFAYISKVLNKNGFKTRRDKQFSQMTVKRLCDRTIDNNPIES